MLDNLLLIAPVFGLMALGALATLARAATAEMADQVSRFLYLFALPTLLFRLLATTELPETLPWGYWLSYFTGMAVVWALAMALSRHLLGLSRADSTIAGLCTGQANAVMVGIPIIIKAYGERAAFPVAMLIAVNLPVTMTTATLLLQRGGDSFVGVLLRNARALATHPILIGIAAGLFAHGIGYRPSGVAGTMIDMIAAMALPGALIALGMALPRYGFGDTLRPAVLVSVLRLAVHPAITFVLARHVFALPPHWAGAAVLFAAGPAGVNAYLFAVRYGIGVGLSSSAIALSTLLSVASSVLWLTMLGV